MLSVLRSFSRHGFNITQIAEKMGISRQTLYNWIEESPKIKLALETGMSVSISLVEDALFKKAIEGDTNACRFLLQHIRGSQYNIAYQGVDNGQSVFDENLDLFNEIEDMIDRGEI